VKKGDGRAAAVTCEVIDAVSWCCLRRSQPNNAAIFKLLHAACRIIAKEPSSVKVRVLNLMGGTPHAKMGKLPNGFIRSHVIVYQ
jgi:hypothetical protein